MVAWLGPAIGAAASLVGGFMGQKSQEKQAAANIALQKEFAQSGIQWKVADAKKAGIHPLVAMGAQTHSFSPVQIGSPMAQGVANAGQDISRAISAGSTASGQAGQYAAAVQGLDLRNRELQNQLLASQIQRMQQTMQPPIPSDGTVGIIDGQGNSVLPQGFLPGGVAAQGNTGGGGRRRGGGGTTSNLPGISIENFDLPYTAQGHPWRGHGAGPDVDHKITASGNYAPVMSRFAQERLEDDTLGTAWWNMRNRIQQMILGYGPPPGSMPNLPPDQRYRLNPLTGEWIVQRYRGFGFWH